MAFGKKMQETNNKKRAPRNRTLALNTLEALIFKKKLLNLNAPASLSEIENRTINQDIFSVLAHLPDSFVDLAIIDPPYNLNKTFNNASFKTMTSEEYEMWLDSWLQKMTRLLKADASVYICGDWRSSGAIFNIAKKYFHIQNRITFEREKGRGAKSNWKNCSEDIWFCTVSKDYYFDVESVKIKRKVIAPYTDDKGKPKDWEQNSNGKYRVTYPSNLWTDITIPFWSMPENTDHPTQKPEKLIAKIILASSRPNDLVFDPFLGSGTTSVVAKKLKRRYLGLEIDELYCCIAEKRLENVGQDISIQGYSDGVFWERNTLSKQVNRNSKEQSIKLSETLFKNQAL